MTPNYMYEDIGKSTQFLRNKDELISSQRSFYKREKEDIRDLLREYYSETSNKSKVKTKLQQYIERYHKKNNPMYSDTCELKVCTTKKPENPIVLLTFPVASELFALCIIRVFAPKGGKNVFGSST